MISRPEDTPAYRDLADALEEDFRAKTEPFRKLFNFRYPLQVREVRDHLENFVLSKPSHFSQFLSRAISLG
jgi:hypothetical protein